MMQNSPVSQKDTGKTDGSSLRSKTPKFLAVLIIFFASTQLGYHFWPLSSLVYGIRIDYLSPTLYFLDVLILVYLGLVTKGFDSLRRSWSTVKMFSRATTNRETGSNPQSIIVALLPVLLANILFSQNPLASLSWSLHFLLYASFIFSLKTDELKIIPKVLLVSLLFQLCVGLGQFYLGHSIGGLLYYVGERMVSVGAPGIATMTLMGETMLRGYGSFSHPNILAGWSVIILLIILRLRPKLVLITLALATLIIFLTNSHAAAISLFGLIIPFYIFKNLKLRLLYFVIPILLFSILRVPTSTRLDLSISQRLDLQQVSVKVISSFAIFGTGAQSSISTYPSVSPVTRLLQPDHNSFTLFLSWFGIFGVLAILYSLRTWNIRHSVFSTLPLLPLFLLDHYLLTSPQGLFFLLLYLQITLNYTHAQKDRQ
jgi:hypothetical protein